MCGRYRLAKDWSEIERRFGATLADRLQPLEPRYNIAPTDEVVAIRRRRDSDVPEAGLLRSGAKMINAKEETLRERPAFRSLVESHRCLIPAEGFYEWRKADGRRPQPFDLALKEPGLFAFAGLWAARKDEQTGDWLRSCTIITCPANELVAPVHDRMPVILAPDDYERWIDSGQDQGHELLKPYPAAQLEAFPVSPRVNSPNNDDPECIAPLAVQASLL